jgi:hypothetical protein
MFESRPSPSTFPSSLIADPAQETIKEVGRHLLQASSRVFLNEGAVSVSSISKIPVDVARMWPKVWMAQTVYDAP